MDLHQKVDGLKMVKACSIKEDKDSTESKTINLEVEFNGIILKNVFDKALSATVVQWQNGPGRKNFNQWKNGQRVKIQFKAPAAAPQIDPETAIINKVGSMTGAEKIAYLKELKSKLKELED